jgi:hypothetical protein
MCLAPPALAQHGWRGEGGGRPQPQQQPQQRAPSQGGWRGSAPAPAPGPRAAGWRGGGPAPAPRPMYAPPGRPPREARDWHQNEGWHRQGGWERHDRWEQHRARDWHAEHRGWGERGGYGGRYIPRERFERRFGPGHPFRIYRQPVIYQGYPRFSYGGSSFLIVDPYPESWPVDWYARGDVYVGYNDGYYLYSASDPSIALAITVMP